MRTPDPAHSPRADIATPGADCFATFFDSTRLHLIGFLHLQGAEHSDAIDIAHDTLDLAYEHWATIRNPRAWAFTTAIRALRRRQATLKRLTTELPETLCPTSSRETSHSEYLHDIVQVLGTLPDQQRQVMAWSLYGHTPADIAEALELNPDTVRSNLRHARQTVSARITLPEDQR